jgi:hypothetical protein
MEKLSTKSFKDLNKKDDNIKDKVQEIKNYHETALMLLGLKPENFYPKTPFMWDDELHVSLFKSEIIAKNFYTELVNNDYSPKNEDRILLKFYGNAECINEYFEKKEVGKFGEYSRYFVPLQEFQEVDIKELLNIEISEKENVSSEENIITLDEDDENEDALMSKLTIRDHAAIQWKLPVSNKTWLNNLIKQINKK